MAFLLRSPSTRPSSIKWIRHATRTRIDGEREDTDASASLFDLQLRPDRQKAIDSSLLDFKPPATDTVEYARFQPPEKTIDLSSIQPDFASTAVGRILMEMGIRDADLERFAERNPRAFHSSTEQTLEWVRSFREKLCLSNDEVIDVLKQFPKLLSATPNRIEKINNLLQERLKLKSEELRSIVLRNPFVYDAAFEVRFEKAMVILYEKFKITSTDVRHLAKTFPPFLTLVDEGKLARTVALFGRVINLGINQLGKVIRECPRLMQHSVFGLHERIMFLLQYKFAESQVRDMILRFPLLLDTKYTSELRHVVNYLEAALNVDWRIVHKIINREPSILKMDTETEIGPNLAAMKNLGFGLHETTLILTRCPSVLKLTLNDADTESKLELLESELHRHRSDLVTYPTYLTFSLSEHLWPRIEFMKRLGREDYKQWPLMKLFGDTDEEFCIRHVKMQPEKYLRFKEKWMQRNQL